MRKQTAKQIARQLDQQIERIYYAHCCGLQINILDIPKIFAAGRAAALAGEDVTRAVVDTTLRFAADVAVPRQS